MSNSVILAGASVRSLAESALRSGLSPVCVDMFADADLLRLLGDDERSDGGRVISIRQFAELPEAVESFDRDIPLIWAGGLEGCPEVIQSLAGRRFVAGMQPSTVRFLRDSEQLQRVLTDAGCRFPEVYCGRSDLDQRTGPVLPGGQWLKKSVQGAGGGHVRLLPPGDVRLSSLTANEIVQRFVPGLAMSAVFCAEADRIQHLGCCLQLVGIKQLGATGFQFCGNVGPVVLAADLQQQLHEVVRVLAGHCELRGLFGIDFVLDDHRGIHVIEVNPRITASCELLELTDANFAGCVSRQLAAFGRSEGCSAGAEAEPPWVLGAPEPVKSADILQAMGGKKTEVQPVFRMIVYTSAAVRVSAELSEQLLGWADGGRLREEGRSGCWLADIPGADSRLPKFSPFCSIYVRYEPGGPDLEWLRQLRPVQRCLDSVLGPKNSSVEYTVKQFQKVLEFGQSDNIFV